MLRVATLAFRRLIGPTKTAWERGSYAVKNHFSNRKKIVCCPRELYQLLYFRLRKGVKFCLDGVGVVDPFCALQQAFPSKTDLENCQFTISDFDRTIGSQIWATKSLGRIFWDHRENKAQLVCLVYLCLGFQILQSWSWRILGFFSVRALECQPENWLPDCSLYSILTVIY